VKTHVRGAGVFRPGCSRRKDRPRTPSRSTPRLEPRSGPVAGAAKDAPANELRSPFTREADQAEVDQELADEAIQRRQATDRDRPDQETGRKSHGISLGESAQVVDLAGVGKRG